MSEREPDDKHLRDAFASQDPPADSSGRCPDDEEIWAASRGDLPPERTRLMLAHSLECAGCKQSWLAASALAAEASLSPSGPQEVRTGQVIPFHVRHHRLLKTVSAVAATVVLMILLTTVLNQHETPVAPLTLAEGITTNLWRVGESQPLAEGDRLRTGDRIYLTLKSDVPVHLYVINKDQAGESATLFPVPGAQWSNPLLPGEGHRLPGNNEWQYDSWEVSSSGGQESFTVVAALEPLPGLESALALLDAAMPQDQYLRGRDATPTGAESDPAQAAAALAQVLEDLRGGDRHQSVVVREIVLENPRSPGP
jgi:hypothetical protein